MAEHAQQRVPRRSGSDVAPSTLLLAALASVAATAVVSRFGLESTLVGAGLTPVVVTLVREIARRPVEQVSAVTGAAGNWRHWRHQQAEAPPDEPEAAPPPHPVAPAPRRTGPVRWGVVGAATLVGFLAAVAFFSVPDLIAGRSLVSNRDSTFFSGGSAPAKEPVAAPTATTTTETTPTTTVKTTTETVTVTSPAPTATAPPADTSGAAPVAPAPPPPAP
ncbi:MAG: hypothetical protein QOD86_3051 [Miltoncostaeaceae bacterium]|nr:hypothetical protein [Miltoncostaeaceae bacterium]